MRFMGQVNFNHGDCINMHVHVYTMSIHLSNNATPEGSTLQCGCTCLNGRIP